MLTYDRLEGHWLQIVLKLAVEQMHDAVRVSGLSWEQCWDRPMITMSGILTPEDIIPGKNAAYELLPIVPDNLGVATTTAGYEQGYLYYNIVAGQNTKALTKTIPNARSVGIYGWVVTAGTNSLDSALTQVDFYKSSRMLRTVPARPGQSALNDTTLMSNPVMWTESEALNIDLWEATARNERITWLGFYTQPKA